MPENFISKMAKYVAFLCREADLWELRGNHKNIENLFTAKIETAMDICAMFGCRDEVQAEAEKIYCFAADPC